jgi:hypothetical protein
MMPRSPLFGRRIHISGSISADAAIASAAEVNQAREFLAMLVKELLGKGATFVIPVDAEKTRQVDNLPICFDWLIWETIEKNMSRRPAGALDPLAIAVQHHKNEEQIPPEFEMLWNNLRSSDRVKIENASHWNMASKRMEAQARWGEILIGIGGGEGVLFLANLYHDAGKPVIPLNLKLCAQDTGALRLFNFGLTSTHTNRLFQTNPPTDAHGWINRINFVRKDNSQRVSDAIGLLESLQSPKAFAVRLLDSKHEDFADVQNYFDTVVQPVVEGELGFKLVVIDGKQALEFNRIDQEIFAKLHRSSVVIADITGQRPNCFLELGYAFGRGLPTMLLGKEGVKHPFDISSVSGHHWKTTGSVDDRRREFRDHWAAIRSRPPLVPMEPLIP